MLRYDNLPKWIKTSLHTKYGTEFSIDSFELPHINKEVLCNNMFWDFYRWYYDLYDMKQYKELMEEAIFLELTDLHRKELVDLCNIGIWKGGGHQPNMESVCYLESFFPHIQNFLHVCSDGVFVKLSHKSSKNDFKMYPSYTITDVFDNLVHSPEVARTIMKSSSIVLKPWNPAITKSSEFRVFVESGHVIAVSQQEWHTPILSPITFDLDEFTTKLDLLVAKLPYLDAVLDINYINKTLTLIEINPGCRWHSSGASLFKWDELSKLKQFVFRVYL